MASAVYFLPLSECHQNDNTQVKHPVMTHLTELSSPR